MRRPQHEGGEEVAESQPVHAVCVNKTTYAAANINKTTKHYTTVPLFFLSPCLPDRRMGGRVISPAPVARKTVSFRPLRRYNATHPRCTLDIRWMRLPVLAMS